MPQRPARRARRPRPNAISFALILALAIAMPDGVRAADPQRGTLGAGLAVVAEGGVPDRSVVTRTTGGAREIAVSVELAGEPDSAIRGRLRSAGLDPRGSWGRTIEGYVRPDRLERLAATAGVRFVRAIRTPIADSFVGQAPLLHGATPWHQAHYSGSGIKVGILDVGFGGFAGRMGTELPGSVLVRCYPEVGIASSNLTDCGPASEAHGTAVAESIVDIAPGASLYLSNAFSPADLAAAITWMTGAGVRIINYSMVSSSLLDGMGDGTSPYSNSDYALVDRAVAGGALFVAAAGNEGATSWMGPPADVDADGWLEFAPGVERDPFDLLAGDLIAVAIRWGTAATDYDLSIWQGDTKVDESAAFQSATGDPWEQIVFSAPAAGTYEIGIRHDSGPDASTVRLMIHTSADTSLAYRTTTGSLPAPADSRNPGMVAVGAVNYLTPAVIEPYSSRGPTLDGRIKPDLVAVDCVDTTVAATFCGTSQAAPFTTGAAALLLEADPTLSPVALATMLKGRAAPLGTPVPNNTFGHGLLSLGPLPDSVAAAASFLAPPASGVAGGPLLGQPTVGVVDATGHVTGTGPGATMAVTLSLAANPTGATLTCAGGATRVAVAGIAVFTGCAIDLPGTGYVLRAEVAGLVPATSTPFSVAPAGSPPRASMALAPATVTLGKPAIGIVSVAPPGLPAGPPTLEWSKDARVWNPSGVVVLDTTGIGQFTLTTATNRWLRARLVNDDGTTDVSAPAFLRVDATVVLRSTIPTGRTVGRTTKITLTETIRPVGEDVAAGRARFDFFLWVGTSWVRKRTLFANADKATGVARIVTTLPTYGSWWIRSRGEATTTNGASPWTVGFRYTVR